MTNGTIDISKVRGLEPEFVDKFNAQNTAASKASADPLPGSLALAFPLPEINVGKFSVRAPVAYDWTLLKAINSPIHRKIIALTGENTTADIEFTDEESWDICYQFTRTCREVDKVFCKGGATGIREAAKEVFAFEVQAFEISEIVKVVITQISRTWETAMSYTADKEKDEASSPFHR